MRRTADWILGALALCLAGGQAATGQSGTLAPKPITLAEALRIALEQSPAVLAAQADARAARSEVRSARAMAGPQVSANAFLTAGDMESMVGSVPDVTPTFSRDVPAGGFAMQNLTVMTPIYTGGRLRGRVHAASERARAASGDMESVRADVAFAVKEAYYRALLAAERVKVARARLEMDRELVRTAQAQADAGKGIPASVHRAEAELADAQREATEAANDREKALLDLAASMGASLASALEPSDALEYRGWSGALEGALAEARRLRPELAAARARVAAAQADTAVARGALQPQVYGAAMADAFAGKGMSPSTGYTVGVAVGFPLLDGGQRRAETAKAAALQERSNAELRLVELRVEREVRQAWLDGATAERNYQTAQAALRSAQAAYDVIAIRVKNQKGIQLELLDALAAVTRARGAVAQALYDHALAAARLDRAIGRT